MEHISYGLFDDDEHAKAAIEAIQANVTPRCHLGVTVHRDRVDEGRLRMGETGAAEGLREGALVGGALGAITGAVVMGPFGLVSGALSVLSMALSRGAIAGSSGPDRTLDQLSKELAPGKVLVIVEAPSLACREGADATLRANGGSRRAQAILLNRGPYFQEGPPAPG
jgi:hypothetical protein